MSTWPGNAQKELTSFGNLTRSQLMSRVRSGGNETTEMRMARLLRGAHIRGWRRHSSILGKPDFVWTHEKVAVFVDGCFWHGHACGRNLTPGRNAKDWRRKIRGNKARDRRVTRGLRTKGWAVLRIWECKLAKNPETCLARIQRALEKPPLDRRVGGWLTPVKTSWGGLR